MTLGRVPGSGRRTNLPSWVPGSKDGRSKWRRAREGADAAAVRLGGGARAGTRAGPPAARTSGAKPRPPPGPPPGKKPGPPPGRKPSAKAPKAEGAAEVDDAVASALAAVRDSRSSQRRGGWNPRRALEEAPAPAPLQRELGELEA